MGAVEELQVPVRETLWNEAAKGKVELFGSSPATLPLPQGNHNKTGVLESWWAKIRQIKPEYARGVEVGEEQLGKYEAEMEKSTDKPNTTELKKYPPRLKSEGSKRINANHPTIKQLRTDPPGGHQAKLRFAHD